MIKQLCGLASQNSKNLRGATAYSYILKPVARGIMILEAAVNELIQFSPFSERNGAAQMQTKYVNRYWKCNNGWKSLNLMVLHINLFRITFKAIAGLP